MGLTQVKLLFNDKNIIIKMLNEVGMTVPKSWKQDAGYAGKSIVVMMA